MALISIPGYAVVKATVYEYTHYVSPTGTDTWANATNINTPCSASTAMANAFAGDVVGFRGGTYSVSEKNTPYHASLEPTNSGSSGSPIIFAAYTGETPIIEGTFTTRVNDFVIGTGSSHYITWDGFTITATGNDVAGIMMGGDFDEASFRHGIELLNITAIAGSNNVINTDNADIVRMEGIGSGVIRGCRFGNLHTASWSDNNAALKSYHNANVLIENNEFFDSPNGISCKSTTNSCIIRDNYFHGGQHGFFMGVYSAQANDLNLIYNNVFVNHSDLGIFLRTDGDDGSHADDWQVYNNTIAECESGVNFGHARDLIMYNNIIAPTVTNNVTTVRDTTIAESDHNQFGVDTFYLQLGVYSGSPVNYSSLASWQSSGYLVDTTDPGVGSLATDPQFVNGSGLLNTLADFEIGASCIGAGRAGADIGADVSTVGI